MTSLFWNYGVKCISYTSSYDCVKYTNLNKESYSIGNINRNHGTLIQYYLCPLYNIEAKVWAV